MKNDAVENAELSPPRREFNCAASGRVTRLPARANARRAEVDILGVIVVVGTRRQQPDDMHARETAVTGQLANGFAVANLFRNVREKLLYDMAEPMNLCLACNVVCYPAGVLDLFLPVKGLPDRLWLVAGRIPQVNCKDEGVPAGRLVEDDFDGCVGENSTIPIELAVDAD